HLAGAHMCFITAGMGGGTGTGAAPIIAQAARELGVLTVGVVTKPFQFEGAKRMRQAEEGVEALQKVVDTLIIIPNQNLFRLANENTTFTEAFSLADDVLYQGVKGVTDLMVRPGLINLDFADVRAVMDEMGKAMMGTGEASGEDRAIQAADKAVSNPLLDEISLRGAKGVLINITGGDDLTLFELDEAANRIREEVDPDANIIVGSTMDTTLGGAMRVSVVATGIDASQANMAAPMAGRRVDAVAAAPEPVVDAFEEVPASELSFMRPAAEAEPAEARDSFFDMDEFEAEDIVPEPAYQPAAQDVETYMVEEAPAMPAATFVVPRPQVASAGTPGPEAMARLRAAVEKTPSSTSQRLEVETRAEDTAGRGRFGINSLINRMTGQAEHTSSAHVQPTLASQPQSFDHDDAYQDSEDQVEIPAFLRRQAN
ncbi:MAG: cell division protein FtsZ, partial [Planktomarina sp.]